MTAFPSAKPMQINDVWYLGIDFGTTGLSAVLLNARTGHAYPIYWETPQAQGDPEYSFRNPAIAYSGMVALSDILRSPVASVAVGMKASKLARTYSGVFIQNFKPFLKIGIPYYSPRTKNWEPVLQWTGNVPVSLYWLGRALQALLATLKPPIDPPEAVSAASGSKAGTLTLTVSQSLGDTSTKDSDKEEFFFTDSDKEEFLPPASVKVGAANLDNETFSAALRSLSGVILGSPAGWGDTYRFNLREAILGTQLVKSSEQIFFIEDAIALTLAELGNFRLPIADLGFQKAAENPERLYQQSNNPKSKIQNLKSLRGGTLAIDAGATSTELALVDLPDNLQDLTHSDFTLRSFAYGGSWLDQDIICQLLWKDEVGTMKDELIPPGSDLGWGATSRDLPRPGEPDLETRYRLQQLLQSSPLGLALLQAAERLKWILQHQDEFTLNLGEKKCVCTRTQLETRVVLPFVRRLNQELNALLSQTKLSGPGIYQVILSGGTCAFGQIQEWLQQKLSNATLIKSEVRSMKSKTDSLHTYSVAYGLATLPLYPQVLERQEQQYSDYFLLLELLRAFPDKPLSVREIMQLLERRGINTRACQQRLIAILEGKLPTNLLPSEPEFIWLTQASQQNLDYQAVAAAPLFYKEGNQTYRPNPQQCQRLWQYLNTLLSGTYQKLEEPLIVDLV